MRLIEAHNRLYAQLLPYFQQGGAGAATGREEFFAETFAEFVLSDHVRIAATYDAAYADFLREVVEGEHS